MRVLDSYKTKIPKKRFRHLFLDSIIRIIVFTEVDFPVNVSAIILLFYLMHEV